MAPFELVEPRSLREAAALLDVVDPATRPVAGGTALMLMMKTGLYRPERLVSLRGVERRCFELAQEPEGLRIGSMVTLSALGRSALVRKEAPVIVATLRTLSNVRVRNVATLGGHLAHADPHMDLPPVLVALGARVAIVGAQGARAIPVEELHAGYLQTTLGRGELIAEVTIPRQGMRRASYLKCTARSADDWPALGVAVSLSVDGGMVREPRIVVGAATDTPMRLSGAERVLGDARVDEALLRRAGEAAAAEANVVADQHGSAAYKQELLRVYVGRAIRAALHEDEKR